MIKEYLIKTIFKNSVFLGKNRMMKIELQDITLNYGPVVALNAVTPGIEENACGFLIRKSISVMST